MKSEEIAAEASKLSEEERAYLASRLLHGLESPVYHVSDTEVSQRIQEAENDPSVWLTFDQLVSGLKRRVRPFAKRVCRNAKIQGAADSDPPVSMK